MRVSMVVSGTEQDAGQVDGLAAAFTGMGYDVSTTSTRTGWARPRPDVVHLHTPTAGAVAAAAIRRGVPVVYTHPACGDVPSGLELALVADHVTAASAGDARMLVSGGVPRARVSVVPAGVDVTVFAADGDRAPRRQERRIVAVGEPGPHAGFSTAVAALRGVPNTELVVVAEATDDLRRYAEALAVVDRVHFAGRRSRVELPALLRSADIVVCTPWRPQPITTVVEAMACGVPVVATDVGALPDAVLDRITGLVVPSRRPRVLATTLRRLFADLVAREQYGASGRERACARYSWDRIAEETLQVYERVGVQVNRPAQAADTRVGRPLGAAW